MIRISSLHKFFNKGRQNEIHVINDVSLELPQKGMVAIFGKSWDFHVTDILQTTLGENINMIKETVAYCKKQNREVVFDAEHFFDGFKANPVYALECVNAALEGGADFVVLCDTNGGTMPFEIQSITEEVKHQFPAAEVGIHCHEDTLATIQ